MSHQSTYVVLIMYTDNNTYYVYSLTCQDRPSTVPVRSTALVSILFLTNSDTPRSVSDTLLVRTHIRYKYGVLRTPYFIPASTVYRYYSVYSVIFHYYVT
jgi:hypothetical protein